MENRKIITEKEQERTPEGDDPQTYAIIGAAMEVHKVLGNGFLEAVYTEALAAELTMRDIPFKREVEFQVRFKDVVLNSRYRVDFLCFENVIVEIKALPDLTNRERSQTINYLKASGLKKALLFNFGAPRLRFDRLVFNL